MFYPNISKKEQLLLFAFSDNGILVLPDIGLTNRELVEVIINLKRKDYITGDRPYRLTAKAKRYLRQLKKQERN